ncbi:MAG: hypothetical protein BWX79_03321 [Alphaproteobacteria bacterium ADurb.Bin100]|nr:MAG: hypothetical protein BWX79_03321 [Alphaproteobacteria bacterium ADurb.Bin100]
MCTWGIDIATQQLTPATHSSICRRRGVCPSGWAGSDRPRKRADFMTVALAPACTAVTGAGRRRNSASGAMVSTQKMARPK